MTNPCGIILLGANGSGKSTLGRELARVLSFAHLDVEDYYFYKTDVPYTAERPHNERNELLLADMKKHGSFVVSGDISGWSDEFPSMFDLTVLLKAPKDVRMKRIKEREHACWGSRVQIGGDMYESQQKFKRFAENRDVAELERRAERYPCPVIEIDSTEDYKVTAANIAERFYTKSDEPWRIIPYSLGTLKTYRFTVIDVVLQENETIDARAATWNEISEMMERGEFIGRDVLPEFDLLEGR